MTDQTGGDQPQKTVAELLAQHGAQVDGGRRRRRRAAEDDDELAPPDNAANTGSHRRPGVSDTGSQAIIDRVNADNVPPAPPPPSQQLPPPQPSQQLPVPPAPPTEETRAQVPPVRRRPAPQPSQQLPTPPPGGGALSARLDGLNGTPDAEIVDLPPAPGGMASGSYATPPPAAPGRPRRAPARRPQPKQEAHTEQFSAVPDEVDELPPAAPPKTKKPKAAPPSATPDISTPAGLANWRKRRQKEQLEDTEIGVMPAVPGGPEDGYPEDDFEPDGFAPESSGYQAAYDEGPPTGTYPPPMPFAPGERPPRTPVPDDLAEYEREFAEPGYPADGPDFDRDDYGYEQGDDYEDEYDEDIAEPAEPEVAASPGKAWLALAGQLALGVVGGAAVWLGFNWLWTAIPAAALVAALLVVVALVWIVRKIRRAEDLQTTVLAVLVGLVVTVSPAALLLVGSR